MSSPAAHDTWTASSDLFDRLNALNERLDEMADVDEALAWDVIAALDLLPQDPEPLSDIDPYLRDALLTAAVHAARAAASRDRRQLRINLERMRHALRDILDERPVWRAGPREAASWLIRTQGLTSQQLASLLDVTPNTVSRWAGHPGQEPGHDVADRVIVIAKIVNHLRHAMTTRGAVQWLQRPHPDLDDRRPVDELKDYDSFQRLIHLAAGTRSGTATAESAGTSGR